MNRFGVFAAVMLLVVAAVAADRYFSRQQSSGQPGIHGANTAPKDVDWGGVSDSWSNGVISVRIESVEIRKVSYPSLTNRGDVEFSHDDCLVLKLIVENVSDGRKVDVTHWMYQESHPVALDGTGNQYKRDRSLAATRIENDNRWKWSLYPGDVARQTLAMQRPVSAQGEINLSLPPAHEGGENVYLKFRLD